MTENFRPTVLRAKARAALGNNVFEGKWIKSVPVCLLLFAVMVVFAIFAGLVSGGDIVTTQVLSNILSFFVACPLAIGVMFMFLDIARGKDVEYNTVKEAFKDYGRYITGLLIVTIFTVLWMLLLIIPGLIKSIAYSQTYFIMRDNPEISANEARKRSEAMMRGHKWEFFLLGLSFIGWILLGILSFGLVCLWVYPYIYTAMGEFYETLKKSAI